MPNKACLTCKERKIACDKKTPICLNCTRSNRRCRPYTIRLSWPKENDKKRAISYCPRGRFKSSENVGQVKFVNTSSRDVEVYEILLDPVGNFNPLPHTLARYLLGPKRTLSNHMTLGCDEAELVPYFFSIVLPSIPAYAINIENLRGVVTRLAISDDSASSRAVLKSVLALAAIYRSGNQTQAIKYIVAALSSLRASVEKGIDPQQVLQHIVVEMLICSFEIHLFSQSSSNWISYLTGVKEIMKRFYHGVSSTKAEWSLLFQWVFYYDTLAALGVYHWQRKKSFQPLLGKEIVFARGISGYPTNEVTSFAGCANKALELLSELSTGALTPEDSNYRSAKYISWLNQIENRLLSLRQEMKQADPLQDLPNPSESLVVRELFVLATLMYHERTSKQLCGPSRKTDEWTGDAFLIMANMEHCNKLFPLFIFGLEAHTDHRRLTILRIIDRTLEKANTCSLESLRELLIKSWVQDDLNLEGNMDHSKNMCILLNASKFVPCLI